MPTRGRNREALVLNPTCPVLPHFGLRISDDGSHFRRLPRKVRTQLLIAYKEAGEVSNLRVRVSNCCLGCCEEKNKEALVRSM